MNIVIVYATYSGSTQMASEIVKTELAKRGHSVTVKTPPDMKSDEFSSYDTVILASPSWNFGDKEGQPHEDFFPFMESLKGKTYEGKKFAVLGLGDSSYQHFCGAVTVLEDFVKNIRGTLMVPSLRVDQFFSNPKSTDIVVEWVIALDKALASA